MKTINFAQILLLATCFVALPAAAVPTVFPVQGFVTDDTGSPIDGAVAAQLSLFESETGGAALFAEDVTLDLSEGSFFHYLGSVTALDRSVVEDADSLFLEIIIDGEILDPRLEIGSVPFAALSGRCEVADAIFVADVEVTGAGLQRRIALPCNSGQAIRSVGIDGIPVCVDVGGGAGGPGDITAVAAGEGLAGGGTVGDLDISVNFDETQRRITASCPTNQFAVGVTVGGTLVCAAAAGGGGIGEVIAGTGLSGGGTTSPVTLDVDFAVSQRRISNACPNGDFALAVAASGTLICGTPAVGGTGDIEGVIAGNGLIGGGLSGSVTLSLAPVSCPVGQFQTGTDLGGAPTCELEVGSISEVIAGGGLTGGGNTGSLTLALDAAACPGAQFQTGTDAAGAPICANETGDIEEVTAGVGLTGGGVAGVVNLDVDDTVFQRRISGCIAGQLIASVGIDGIPICVDFPQGRYQLKALAADAFADGPVVQLSFANLIVGKVYRVTGQIAATTLVAAVAPGDVQVTARNAGATILSVAQLSIAPGTTQISTGLSTTFTAVDTQVVVSVTGLGTNVILNGDGDRSETFVVVEELGNALVTTDW